ncbi:unnamed protein product [Strongylus vulgaris]|uniref:Tetraspanin n=1 Tax=Strongylus vulgaris TaxID=40348 RepID=A0A3P7J9I9_STRVU|nr:unnamed protein product [Strongylus vulgaris]
MIVAFLYKTFTIKAKFRIQKSVIYCGFAQIAYNCCGINGSADYQDLSSVKIYGISNPLPRDKTLNDCPHEDVACLYPLSCCFSVECTEYRLAELDIEGEFHERWYKSRGCVHALFSANYGLLEPRYSIILIFLCLGMQIIGLIFAQLTLTGYLTLAESGLSDADESIAWLLPFSYPGPEDIVQVRNLLKGLPKSGALYWGILAKFWKNELKISF